MNRSSIEDICPLTPMQEGLLFHSLHDADSEAYFVQMHFRFEGDLNPELFARSWGILFDRHAALRSVFMHEGLSRPVQVVLKGSRPPVTHTDLLEFSQLEQRERIERYKTDDRSRKFDLQRGILMRFAVFKCELAVSDIVWSFHHILMDGWSLGVLLREFTRTYVALSRSEPLSLPPVFPHAKYYRWLEAQDREAAREFWRTYLLNYRQLATIPSLSNPRAGRGHSLHESTFVLDEATSAGLRDLAARSGVTLNTLMQCTWGLILSRYNNVQDVVFGAVSSGRSPELSGVEDMVGLCINSLPVRVGLRSGRAFTDVLREVQQTALAALPHHHLSLVEIQAQSPMGGGLFDHLVTFENFPVEGESFGGDGSDRPDFGIETLNAHDRTHYDFTLICTPLKNIHFRICYNLNRYSHEQMHDTACHLRTALRNVLHSPDRGVDRIDILTEAERRRIIVGFNDTKVQYPEEPGLVGLFERQAETTPGNPAVTCEDRRLSYRELNERANHVAHHLLDQLRVRPDDRIGLLLDRSEQVLVAVLGILKAGAAYVPIDPDYPPLRIRRMLMDSDCRAVVTEEKNMGKVPGDFHSRLIDIRGVPAGNPANTASATSPSHLAYVVFTSGSTGDPKGCQIELGNLLNYLLWANDYYFARHDGGTFGLYSSLSFDLTVTSLFLPLLRGRTVRVFPPERELLDVLTEIFSPDSDVDCIKLTPSHISLLKYLNLPPTNVRLAIVGGEQLSTDQVRILRGLNPEMEVYNEYGPSETTVGCTVKRMGASDERILIGGPVANTQIYIMGDAGCVPVGVAGEIFVGGAGVGRGYIRRDGSQPGPFIDSPFGVGGWVYRTGDLGRWMPDGNIELLGRLDDQVKIRGHRIEPGEIEAQLVSHNPIREAVVVARGREELVAYVTTAGHCALDVEDVRDDLRARLPEYMVPAHFVHLERLPLNPNGKVDRSRLPDPVDDLGRTGAARSAGCDTTAVAPGDETENRLAKIWREVLQIETFGVCDNFFKLGGHSLKAMQVVARVQKEFGVKVSLQSFFQTPTIRALRGLVGEGGAIDGSRIEPAPPQPHYALSHAQRRLWLLHHMRGETAYNIPRAFLFEGSLDIPALRSAFASLIDRHEALRTAFILVDGEPRQSIHRHLELTLREVDLSGHEDADQRAQEIVGQESSTPFELANPPLLRMTVIKLAEERYVLVFVMHHIIGDGWSMTVLYPEVLALYEAFRRGLPNPLEPLRIQYKDFSEWQNKRSFERDEQYWLAKLAGVPERIRLTYDFPPEDERDFRGDSLTHWLDAETTRGLRELAKYHGTTTSTVVLALFKLFLFQLTKQDDLCIGVSIANRNRLELENLIGFFVNILPVRTHFSEEMEFESLLEQVAQNALEAFEHQDYPFDMLVEKINPSRESNRQPLVNVIYGFQNYEDIKPGTSGTAGPSATDPRPPDRSREWAGAFEFSFETSKFDLTLFVADAPDNLIFALEFDTGLFLRGTVLEYMKILDRFARMIVRHSSTAGGAR